MVALSRPLVGRDTIPLAIIALALLLGFSAFHLRQRELRKRALYEVDRALSEMERPPPWRRPSLRGLTEGDVRVVVAAPFSDYASLIAAASEQSYSTAESDRCEYVGIPGPPTRAVGHLRAARTPAECIARGHDVIRAYLDLCHGSCVARREEALVAVQLISAPLFACAAKLLPHERARALEELRTVLGHAPPGRSFEAAVVLKRFLDEVREQDDPLSDDSLIERAAAAKALADELAWRPPGRAPRVIDLDEGDVIRTSRTLYDRVQRIGLRYAALNAYCAGEPLAELALSHDDQFVSALHFRPVTFSMDGGRLVDDTATLALPTECPRDAPPEGGERDPETLTEP